MSQTIFRVHRENRDKFAQIENETIRDNRMSFKATGLLCYLLSLPGDWEVSQNHLATVKKDGRDSVIAGFKELVELGYLVKKYERDANGQIATTIWNVFEACDGPKSDYPTSDKPKSVKPTLRSTNGKENRSPGATSIESKIEFPSDLDTIDFAEAWDEWVAFRKEKRMSPYKDRGIKSQFTRLLKWGEARAVAAIEYSIAQQFDGIYEEKTPRASTTHQRGHSNRNEGTFNQGKAAGYAGIERLT